MRGVRTLLSNRKAAVGAGILVFFLLMATVGPMVFRLPTHVNFADRYAPPSWQHILGTDYGGRDTFAELVWGSRDVLTVGFLGALFTLAFGVTVGLVSGTLGGWVDSALMLLTNLLLTIPTFPMQLMVAATFQISNNVAFALMIAIFSWAGLARAIRAQVLSLKEREFVLACRVMGVSTAYIILREILPMMAPYIGITFIQSAQGAIVASVGVMLLGLAPFSPNNWGMMLQYGLSMTGGILNSREYLYLLSPIVALGLFGLGTILLANGLDEVFNPRLRRAPRRPVREQTAVGGSAAAR